MNKPGKIIFFIIIVFYWLSVYTYIPIFSPYCIHFGAEAMLPAILGSYGLMQVIFRIPIGIWMDKLQRSRLFVMLGLLFGLFSAIGLYFSSSPFMLLLFRAFAGISASFYAAFTIAYTGYFRPEESVKAVGYVNTACVLGTVLASLAGGFVSEHLGDQATFMLSVIVSLAALGLWLTTRETVAQCPSVSTGDFFKVAKNRLILIISFLGAIFQYISFAIIAFSPVRGVQLGAGKTLLGILLFLLFLPSALSSILAGRNKKGAANEKKWLVISFAGSAASCLLVAFTNDIVWLIVSQVGEGLSSGIQSVYLTNFVLRSAPPSIRTTAVSFYQAAYSLGLFFGAGDHGAFCRRASSDGLSFDGGPGRSGCGRFFRNQYKANPSSRKR